ncbi:MAG: glucuronate isomerase [Clostridia bacterium]|nr:glucuronate isomerase [Clostridia bacterium]
MKKFLSDDFLLGTDTAAKLYHTCAEKAPIVDYHCHIPASDIADDIKYDNITQIWLYADHYKWRAMRACGVEERYITGDASDREKFSAYCKAVPKLIGNPLYHWSALELKRYFGCEKIICPENEEYIWDLTKERLHSPDMSAKAIIKRSNVKALCTTDDPADGLAYHKAIAEDASFETRVYPAFRPDKAVNMTVADYPGYMKKLGEAAGVEIRDLDSLKTALTNRIEYFISLGMKTVDHGVDDYLIYRKVNGHTCDAIFRKALSGKRPDEEERNAFRCYMLRFLASEYVKYGTVMQIHYGVLRNPNAKMFGLLGADSGYDTIYGRSCIYDLARLLDSMNSDGILPKTVIYSVDPGENAALDSLCCAFNGDGEVKMQHGSAWWFNDSIPGIREQLRSLSNLSSLGSFIGMTTDSRSLLSYTRHEYFRRVLCGYIGELVEDGQYPDDMNTLGEVVTDICYRNTVRFFGF